MMFPHDSWLIAALHRARAEGFCTLAAQLDAALQHPDVNCVRHSATGVEPNPPQASARPHQLVPNSKQASAMVDGVGAQATMNSTNPMIRLIWHLHVTGELNGTRSIGHGYDSAGQSSGRLGVIRAAPTLKSSGETTFVFDRARTTARRRELPKLIHAIKRRVPPAGKVSFDAERNARGHADKFWAVALACQSERQLAQPFRVLG